MAKKKNKKASSSHAIPRGVWKPAIWILAAGALIGGGWFGSRAAWDALAGRPEFRIDSMLDLDACPSWVRAGPMALHLRQALNGEPLGRSIFDRHAALIVAAHLKDSPWVLEVGGVERRLPNSLRVRLTFRRPAGIVWTNGKRYMVDRDGHWLPDDLFQEPAEWAGLQMPVIEDQIYAQIPNLGSPWNGPRYAVGARLTDFLLRGKLLPKLYVSVIDVTGVGRNTAEPDIAFTVPWVRDNGKPEETRVRWGKSSLYEGLEGLETPLLVTSDEEKLSMLLAELALYPGLRGLSQLDLWVPGQAVFRHAQ